MKCRFTVFILLVFSFSVSGSGCSQAAIHPTTAAPKPPEKPRALTVSRGVTELKLLADDPNLVKALEELLAQVHSEKVTLPAEALRSLVRTEKGRRSQLRDLSGQLEAIKNIDVQEAGGSKQDGGSEKP